LDNFKTSFGQSCHLRSLSLQVDGYRGFARMNTVHVSFCTSCGHVVKNWLGTCVICRSKNSLYVQAIDQFELDRKIKSIKTQYTTKSSQSGNSSFLIVALALIIGLGALSNQRGNFTTVLRGLSQHVTQFH
jgi:predicted ATP-dependent serine protease